MVRGPKKHMKRLAAPKHWMLDKLSGTFAPKPSSGPHKQRECLPLVIFLRNRLKYALTYHEVKMICKMRQVKIDGKVRADPLYPAGFMDVITLEKTGENFRLLYDVKGRYTIHRIADEESKYKLCKVRRIAVGKEGVPYCVTHDGRTIRYPDPLIKANDTILFDLEEQKIKGFEKFDVGSTVMITGGHNKGRVGTFVHKDKADGQEDTVHIKDSLGHTFATLSKNVFVLGHEKVLISLPKGKGVKLSIAEERDRRLERKRAGH
eukprot:Clim_evm248s157 gene=Clim_evmTU248s157